MNAMKSFFSPLAVQETGRRTSSGVVSAFRVIEPRSGFSGRLDDLQPRVLGTLSTREEAEAYKARLESVVPGSRWNGKPDNDLLLGEFIVDKVELSIPAYRASEGYYRVHFHRPVDGLQDWVSIDHFLHFMTEAQ